MSTVTSFKTLYLGLTLATVAGCGPQENDSGQASAAQSSSPRPAATQPAATQPVVTGPAATQPAAPFEPSGVVDSAAMPIADPQTWTTAAEPAGVPNDGVWIHAAQTIANGSSFVGLAHGTGSEWEYYGTNALPSYGRAGIGGTGEQDVWLVNSSATRFDGTEFSMAQLPWDLTDVHLGLEIGDVWANAANDVWVAVGPSSLTLEPLPLSHFDGSGWTTVDAFTDAIDVWSSGPNDVWALTYAAEVYQFDGSDWQLHPVEGPCLWGTGPNDVWVGMRWHFVDGQWQQVDAPAETPDWLRLWGSGPEDVWALDMTTGTPLFHFDGDAWTEQVSAPSTSAGSPSHLPSADIFGRMTDDVWVVGSQAIAGAPLAASDGNGAALSIGTWEGHIVHYDGETWTDVTPPLLEGANLVRVWISPSAN